ncbi:MAG: glycosyltransferase [Candidatus Omnitrophica bacterium]|nr:glycosyltransferase [Candidatus Omnitrophota bacterium]
MDHSGKVLILYASAGHGHEKAARALEAAYRDLYPHRPVICRDVLEFSAGFLGSFYENSYLWQIRHLPRVWGFFYYLLDIRWVYGGVAVIRRLVNALMVARLEKFLIQESPVVILATHFLPIEVTDHLKKKGKLKPALIAVVTDYLPHCIWTAVGVDHYVVAAEETQAALIEKGVDPSRIKILGIPTEPKFLKAFSRASLCARFGISENTFTVLITSGGAGIGALALMARSILEKDPWLQVLMVCGTNRGLEQEMRALAANHRGFKVFGFVNNMEELMEAADLTVGKGGGLTITESFVKGKPVILFRPVPGQESRNGKIVEKNGAGFVTNTPHEVAEKVHEVAGSKTLYLSLKEGVQKLSKPQASKAIVELAENALLG